MDNNSKEKNKSLRRAMTAEKLTEMLREIDISAAVESEGTYTATARLTALFDHGTFSRIGAYMNRTSDPDEPAGARRRRSRQSTTWPSRMRRRRAPPRRRSRRRGRSTQTTTRAPTRTCRFKKA